MGDSNDFGDKKRRGEGSTSSGRLAAIEREGFENGYMRGNSRGEIDGLRLASQMVLTKAAECFKNHRDDLALPLRELSEQIASAAEEQRKEHERKWPVE